MSLKIINGKIKNMKLLKEQRQELNILTLRNKHTENVRYFW